MAEEGSNKLSSITPESNPQQSSQSEQIVAEYIEECKSESLPDGPNNPSPPFAQLDSHPPTQYVNEPVKFDATNVKKYEFDFGDGSPKVTTTEPTAFHQYAEKGSYQVSVKVTDKHGKVTHASLTQRIIDRDAHDPSLPYAAITFTPKDPKSGDEVRFDASKSVDCNGDPIKDFAWNFGDFSPKLDSKNTPVVNHTYEEPDTYPVTVTVTAQSGKSSKATCNAIIVPPPNSCQPPPKLPPTIILKSNPQETMPTQPVPFDASDSHDYQGSACISYKWDFGDCTSQITTTPYTTHPYKESGTYTATVIGTDIFNQTGQAS